MADNVAFFLPHFGHGGAEGVVLRLLQGLDRERFAPRLILQRRRGELLSQVPGDVPLVELRRARPPLCILELARLYARERIALAVTVTNAANLYSILAARLAGKGVKTLATEHTPMSVHLAETSHPALRRAAIRAIFPRADLMAGPLDEIGTDLTSALGASAPPFVTLPNPVVEGSPAPGPVRADAHRLVSVGRLAPEKRFDLLIDAFATLNAEMPATTLTIHGDGAERAALERRIESRGLAGKATLPGYTADLDAAHGSADLFVCTSRREGLGNAMIEAMARAVPVLSVDCPFGPRRLLRDGAAGRLVEDDSPAAIAEAIAGVLRDPARRARYAEEGRRVASGYQVDRAVAAYADAFDCALGRTAQPRREPLAQ